MNNLKWHDAKNPTEKQKTKPVLLSYSEPGETQNAVREAYWDNHRGCWLLSDGNVIIPLERANEIAELPTPDEEAA